MQLKHGASLEGVNWRMFWAAIVAESIFAQHGSELVITSGTDSKHGANSLHYSGLALDFRTWNVNNVLSLKSDLQQALGDEYDVVVESDHLHVEYDPA